MDGVPGGTELACRSGQFENRQKTRLPKPSGGISPYFACLIEGAFIQISALRLFRIGPRGFVRFDARGRIQIASGKRVQVATCKVKFTRTARCGLVEWAHLKGTRTEGDGSRQPARPQHDRQDRYPGGP